GEVAVVVRLLLRAQRGDRTGGTARGASGRVEMERLLDDHSPVLQDRLLACDLRPDPALDEAEGVHVLQLGLDAQLARAARAQRYVRVAAQRPLLHVHVADPQLTQRRAQQLYPLARLLGR